MEPKVRGIVAYITPIGWIIAFATNNPKDEFASFHIRQMLGLFLVSFVGGFIPVIGLIIALACFVLWIMALIGAIQGEKKLTPFLGEHFQNWFKGL